MKVGDKVRVVSFSEVNLGYDVGVVGVILEIQNSYRLTARVQAISYPNKKRYWREYMWQQENELLVIPSEYSEEDVL